MIPVRTLPENYRLLRAFDLRQEPRLVILLNVIGLALFAVFGAALFALMAVAHPNVQAVGFRLSGSAGQLLRTILAILAIYAATLALHELAHGAVFLAITRSLPRFGIGSAYAYAAAPQWYIPRNLYIAIGLAPLVVISAVGIVLLPRLPASALLAWWFALTVNASGAVGDLFIVAWLLLRAPHSLINDHGDHVAIYVPAG